MPLLPAPRLLFLLVTASALTASAVPGVLGYQGRLLNADGTAASGVVDVTFSLHADALRDALRGIVGDTEERSPTPV